MTIRFTRKHGHWLWTLIYLVHYAAAQRKGFISIDCGASGNSTDPDTEIVWTTDVPYISTGINQNVVSVPSGAVNEQQLDTLRYFPANRSRHCYTLPASRNSSYLLRATFLHGGFQPEVDNSFDLSIDSTIVETIIWTANDEDAVGVFEYVVAATSNRVNFCLLPKVGVAFISTLELRPLEVGMYDVVFAGRYLKAITRLNCGAQPTDPPVRYPDDVYDRIWTNPGANFKIARASTTTRIPLPDTVFDRPPLLVMQTAWVDSDSFWWFEPISEYELGKTSTYYVNHFLAEVVSDAAASRIMDIDLNDKLYLHNITVNSETNQIFLKTQTLTSTGANFTFSGHPDSNSGPILNGAEIYASRTAVSSSTDERDVGPLELVKNGLGLSSWTGDPCLPVPYNWLICDEGTTPRVTEIHLSKYNLVGTIPASIAELTALTELLLDNNRIKGGIPDLRNLRKLKTLHLQNNSLSGGIPTTLASLPVLTELFLSDNKLSGPIPAALANRNGLDLETSGNVKLCAPTENCPTLGIDPSDDNGGGGGGGGGGGSGALIGGIAGGAVVVLVIIGLLVWLYCRRRPKPTPVAAPLSVHNRDQAGAYKVANGSTKASNASSSRSVGGAAAVQQARTFTLAEVRGATQAYKSKIGEGGFGPVYYGTLPDGTELAVKVNSDTSGQGTTEFLNEVSLLSRVHHKNLVALLGYCEEDGQQILIYEYMAKGTLREHLYGKDMKGRISWKERLDIALNAAKGLEYLHNDCIPKIIHRDIKSNNILLNEKLLAKVADFGISKLAPEEGQTAGVVSTKVRGTTGYLDPEYYAHNKLTQKSDVYSFGVLLLEIICGRPPISSSYAEAKQYNLVEWARGQLNGSDLESIVDPAIKGTYNVAAMWKVAELAMGCVEPFGVNRPDMKMVLRGLNEASEFEDARTQAYGPPGGMAPGGGGYGETATFSTESSYPSTQGSVTSVPEYPRTDPSAPPLLFTPPATFVRLPSDTRESGSSWLAPKPR